MIRSELENPTARYFAAESDGQLIGYAGVQIVLDEGYITNIASRPDMRRQGVGNALLEALADLARKKDLSFLTLEVRLSNAPAIALYTRHDFVPVGVRKNYYHKPAEDALLMTLFLKGEAP